MSGEITDRDLALSDLVNEISPDTFPIDDRPLTEAQRRQLIEQACRTQRKAFEQAQLLRPVVRHAIAEREQCAAARPRLYQPFAGACIVDVTTGEPYWSEQGGPYVEGLYFASIGAAERARYNAIERAHRAAVREDDYRTRQAAERAVRWELTDAGRAALSE
jgi:hypothetical protein